MRFESLTLENYGRTKETILEFPASPGLALIFGPNEAGKSTSLEAISDFLYGVPERSARGQIFGADKIAIKATIVRADGTRLALKRRKGRGRTLTDAAGQTVDEAVLGLGAASRENSPPCSASIMRACAAAVNICSPLTATSAASSSKPAAASDRSSRRSMACARKPLRCSRRARARTGNSISRSTLSRRRRKRSKRA